MSERAPLVSVVIPNFNGLEHLPECFQALAEQTLEAFETVFVDDASTDGSVEWVRANAPSCVLVARSENGGFAAAVNAGIEAARGEYVVLLNNDTAAEPGWLAALIEALDGLPGYDTAASKMVMYGDRALVNCAGDTYDLAQMVGRNRGLRRPTDRYGARVRVTGASAGAAAYRRSLFDRIGMLDERFFLNAEDTDFNLRALLAGAKCVYVPEAVVFHKVGGTISALPSWDVRRLTMRNEIAAVFKNWPGALLPLAYVFWPYRTVRGVFPVNPRAWKLVSENLRRLPDRFRAESEGRRMGLAARGETQSLRRIGTLEFLRWVLKGTGPVV